MAPSTRSRTTPQPLSPTSPRHAANRTGKQNSTPTRRSARTRSQTSTQATPDPSSAKKRGRPRGQPPSTIEEEPEEPEAEPWQQKDAGAADSLFVSENEDAGRARNDASPDGRSLASASRTFSQTETEMINPDTSLLYGLNMLTDDLLDHLLPMKITPKSMASLVKELQVPTSSRFQILRSRKSVFDRVHDQFHQQHFNSPSAILMKSLNCLTAAEVGTGDWRPDGVFLKANLAVLADTILTPDRNDLIPLLESAFPASFASEVSRGNNAANLADHKQTSMLEETLTAALQVRIQFFIYRLESSLVDEDPVVLLGETFFIGDYRDGMLKGWPVAGLQEENGSLPHELHHTVRKGTERLQKYLPDVSTPADLRKIETQFSWENFQVQLTKWIQARRQELDSKLNGKIGVDNIQQLWKEEVDRRTNEPSSTHRPFSTQGKSRSMISSSKRNLKRLKRRKSSGQTDTPVRGRTMKKAQRARQQGEDFEQDEEYPDLSNANGDQDNAEHDEEDPKLPPTNGDEDDPRDEIDQGSGEADKEKRRKGGGSSNLGIVSTSHKQPAPGLEAQREEYRRRFIDAQPGARTIAAESDSDEPSIPVRRLNVQSQLDELEDSASDDAGFESIEGNGNAMNANRQRTHALQTDRASSKRRARGVAESPPKRRRDGERPSTAAQPNRSGSQPSSPSMEYEAVHQVALGMGHSRTYEPQVRKAWESAEVKAILEGIKVRGPKWSAIKDWDSTHNGDVLRDRTQVNLKDKARNMKFEYLKCDVELPENMEHVPLDRKLMTRLEELGVPYSQKRLRNVRLLKP